MHVALEAAALTDTSSRERPLAGPDGFIKDYVRRRDDSIQRLIRRPRWLGVGVVLALARIPPLAVPPLRSPRA